MEDNPKIYATVEYVDKKIDDLDRKMTDSNMSHEANFDRLTILFEAMQATFTKLDTTLTKLADSQDRTNDEIKNLAIKHVEIEMRQKYVEEDVEQTKDKLDSFGLSRKAYALDALKVVTGVIVALIGLVGTIITVALT